MAEYRNIAALGSSFAAGPGIPPLVERFAMRSGRNYPHILAEMLGATITDLTVSGATTETVIARSQRVLHRTFPPQVLGIPRGADLVTITVGGNDLGYLASMIRVALASRMHAHTATRPLARLVRPAHLPTAGEEDVERTAEALARVVQATRARAPRARIVLVDYLTIIEADTRWSPTSPFTPAELDGFRCVADALEAAFALAAERTEVDLVEASKLSHGHGLGSSVPWVHGVRRPWQLTSWFHPNAAAMRAIAGEIYRVVTDELPAGEP